MKRQIVLIASVIFAVTTFPFSVAAAQTLTPEQVPGAVKQGFQAKFPTVKVAEWKIKSDKRGSNP